MSSELDELRHFLNEEGQLLAWPTKRKKQAAALLFLASTIEIDKIYTEKEINDHLNHFHVFQDPALLRRELFMNHYVDRKLDGSAYWKTEKKDMDSGEGV